MDTHGLSIAFAITSGLIQAFAMASVLNLGAPVFLPARREGALSGAFGLVTLVLGVSIMCALEVHKRPVSLTSLVREARRSLQAKRPAAGSHMRAARCGSRSPGLGEWPHFAVQTCVKWFTLAYHTRLT